MSPRRMFTVALVGPDGSGKTTIARRLEAELSLPVKYLYMGVNAAASNHLLPTTRLARRVKRALGAAPDAAGPPDPAQLRGPPPRGTARRALAGFRAAARLVNLVAEEWYRQLIAWKYVQRGTVVVFDRHFFSDYHAYDIAGARRPLGRRIHGFALSRLYPKPDLVIFLDAPADVLLARKGEGTLEALARRRGDYLEAGRLVRHFTVVDASRSEAEVAAEVGSLIGSFAVARSLPPISASPAG